MTCSTVSSAGNHYTHSSEKNPVHVDCVYSLSRVPGPIFLLRFHSTSSGASLFFFASWLLLFLAIRELAPNYVSHEYGNQGFATFPIALTLPIHPLSYPFVLR